MKESGHIGLTIQRCIIIIVVKEKFMKRILLVIVVLFLFSCDSQMKRCTYDVYQAGRKISDDYIKYIRPSEWCESYSKSGTVYRLKKVDMVKVKDIIK